MIGVGDEEKMVLTDRIGVGISCVGHGHFTLLLAQYQSTAAVTEESFWSTKIQYTVLYNRYDCNK